MLVYDFFIWFFNIIFQVFFRTIRVRGAWRIPREGAVIFVGAPHANQFVDPILLGIQAYKRAGRRACFLIAEKSYRHPMIGFLARMMNAIPVGRAQDSFVAATGEVFADGKNSKVLHGRGTKFLSETSENRNISFHGFNDLAPIGRVLSDTELELAKPFKTARCREMMQNGFAPVEFKIGERIDNTSMFHTVFEHLHRGDALGIFPEGGSHDRTTLLPLKPGVAIMALGASADAEGGVDKSADKSAAASAAAAVSSGTPVAVVPVGMNYFHPHKFRSRAVVEFGEPLYASPELVREYADGGAEGKKSSVAKFMTQIADALQLVTINCPDYETLMVVQAGQRLYKPTAQPIPLSLTIEFTRRFVQGYIEFREKDPRIRQLFNSVKRYNNQLLSMGISDHQVSRAQIKKRLIFARLLQRVALLLVISLASLPGVLLGSPILVFTKLYSNRKARLALAASSVKIQANDVIATWKILCSLVAVPCLFGVYSLFLTYALVNRPSPAALAAAAAALTPSPLGAGTGTSIGTSSAWAWAWAVHARDVLGRGVVAALGTSLRARAVVFLLCFWGFHLLAYATIITGEAGIGIFKSLKPLYLALSPFHKDSLRQLRETRERLRGEITALVNELGPQLFPDISDRLEHVEQKKPTEADPRIDIRGLQSSLNLRGDYDLAKVSVFSAESAPAVLRRRR